jgi:xanthine dehydrogenase small subunit
VHETGHRLFGAATDLGVQHNKGQWRDQQAISLHLVPECHQLNINGSDTLIGARVTLSHLEEQLESQHPEWADFMHVFASPQIKNNGTLIGNIANGSPIGDNLPFLLAMDAGIHIQGPDGQRQVNINDFYLGYRHNDLTDGELISHINLPHKAGNSFMRLYKASRRRDLDISCVGCAFYLVFDDQQRVRQASLALGGVAATALRISAAEALLKGLTREQLASPEHLNQVSQCLNDHITPMSDVRGSDAFRRQLVSNYYRRFITELNLATGADDAL